MTVDEGQRIAREMDEKRNVAEKPALSSEMRALIATDEHKAHTEAMINARDACDHKRKTHEAYEEAMIVAVRLRDVAIKTEEVMEDTPEYKAYKAASAALYGKPTA